MRTVNLVGAALLALGTGAWSYGAVAQTPPDSTTTPPADTSSAPAPDASTTPAPKPAHHAHHKASGKGKLVATKAGDKAVDDLNAQSLDAAKADKTFTPPTTTPPAAQKEAHATTKPMHHHKMAKKAAPAAPADASSPPADTSSPSK